MKISVLFTGFLLLSVLFVVHSQEDEVEPVEDGEDDLEKFAKMDMEETEPADVVEPNEEPEPAPKVNKERPKYKKPEAKGNTYFAEPFNDVSSLQAKWILSEAKKDGAEAAVSKYDGKWVVEEAKNNPIEGDLQLVLQSQARHHAIAAKLERPFEFIDKPFIAQYEVLFQNGIECGGSYMKLLTETPGLDLKKFTDKSPYTIMFGPDKCGLDYKIHFIFRHRNPLTGTFEEKHAKKPSGSLDTYFNDKKTHLYTLAVYPDNAFEVYVDQKLVNSGNLLTDMQPPVNPEKEIDDNSEKIPTDWDEREKIPDPEAFKPEDWDEDAPAQIPDPNAQKPEGWLEDESELVPDPEAEKPTDWDDDMDGEWEAPMISNPICSSAPGCGKWKVPMANNPNFKGKWKAALITNPDYKGKWAPKKIPNPNYFEDKQPFKMSGIGALGLELWSMTDGITFDNFIITDDKTIADEWAADTWRIKTKEENASASTVYEAIKEQTNERPWLWAVFIVVILLPIVLIVAYCFMSGSKASVVDALYGATEGRPWMWAIYIAVILLPIVGLSIWLCPRSGPIKPSTLAERKKTDEPTPDDKEEENEEEVEEEAEQEPEGEEENEDDAGGDAPVEKETSKNSKKKGKGALEESNGNSNDTKTSPRRRKARKD